MGVPFHNSEQGYAAMSANVVECILKRKGGTTVDLDGTTYHFRPNENGAHVCPVKISKHLGRFLSIVEGYRLYDEGDDDLDQDETTTSDTDSALMDAERGVLGVSTGTEVPGLAAAPEQTDDVNASHEQPQDEALRARYEEVLGRKPHPNAKPDTMQASIDAALAEAK